jgi:hypothetical protein
MRNLERLGRSSNNESSYENTIGSSGEAAEPSCGGIPPWLASSRAKNVQASENGFTPALSNDKPNGKSEETERPELY